MIAVPQIRILIPESEAIQTRLLRTGVVHGQAVLDRIFIGDADYRVNLAFLAAATEQYSRLFCRILVDHPEVVSNTVNIRRIPRTNGGQASRDICLVEKLAALDHEPADPCLNDLETNLAFVKFLLGQYDLNGAVALVGIGALQGLERTLDICKILGSAGKRSDGGLDFFLLQQSRAFNQKTANIKFWLRCSLGLTGWLRLGLRMEGKLQKK